MNRLISAALLFVLLGTGGYLIHKTRKVLNFDDLDPWGDYPYLPKEEK